MNDTDLQFSFVEKYMMYVYYHLLNGDEDIDIINYLKSKNLSEEIVFFIFNGGVILANDEVAYENYF